MTKYPARSVLTGMLAISWRQLCRSNHRWTASPGTRTSCRNRKCCWVLFANQILGRWCIGGYSSRHQNNSRPDHSRRENRSGHQSSGSQVPVGLGRGKQWRLWSDGIAFNAIRVPASFNMKEKEPFDQAYMRTLFNLGYEIGKARNSVVTTAAWL